MSMQNSIWLCIFTDPHIQNLGRGNAPLPPRFRQPCLVSKAFSYVQLGIPQTLLLYCPHLFSLSNALHWFGLSACGTTWPFDLQVHSKVGVIHKWRIFFLGFWHHSHMPTVFYTFSSVNFDQFSIPSFPSRMYFMNNPGPRHLSANKGNGYV